MPEYGIDPKFTEGVWYDSFNGDFAKIETSADGTVVKLINPETDEAYWDMPVEAWVEKEKQHFRPVSDEAVEDPVAVVNRALRMQSRNDVNELASVPFQEAIDLRYAREQVEIQEK